MDLQNYSIRIKAPEFVVPIIEQPKVKPNRAMKRKWRKEARPDLFEKLRQQAFSKLKAFQKEPTYRNFLIAKTADGCCRARLRMK